MKNKASLSIIISAALLIPNCLLAYSKESAGYVVAINGSVYWKQSKRAKTIRLDPHRDIRHPLRPGEWVRCGSNGFLQIRVYGRTINIKESTGWYPIPVVPTSQMRSNAPIIKGYNRTGGRVVYNSFGTTSPGSAIVGLLGGRKGAGKEALAGRFRRKSRTSAIIGSGAMAGAVFGGRKGATIGALSGGTLYAMNRKAARRHSKPGTHRHGHRQ